LFQTITERQGLANNFCYDILQDRHGLLWIATANGLSRYDGVHFYNFKAGTGNATFLNNHILDLCEDKNGNIWGGTRSGIFRYNFRENTFSNFIPPTYEFVRGISNIVCDRTGIIWATSEWNVLRFNSGKNKFEEIIPFSQHKDSATYYAIRQNGLLEDPAGRGIWLATRQGLILYNHAENKYYSFKNQVGNELFANHSVSALTKTSKGHFWFFDNVDQCIIAFDPLHSKILRRIYTKNFLPRVSGQTLFEDRLGKLWFGTWNQKMMIIDYEKNVFTPLEYKNGNPLSIGGYSFWRVFEDKDQNIWLANSGGLSRCNYSKSLYSIYPIIDKVAEFKNCRLGAFSIDPRDNSWWMASEGQKVSLIQYFPQSGKYRYFDFLKAIKNKAGNLPGPVFTVSFIDNNTYIFTHTGAWKLDTLNGKFVPFQIPFKGYDDWQINSFLRRGNELIISTGRGIVIWNTKTNSLQVLKNPKEVLEDGQRTNYSMLFLDSKNRTWYVPAFGWLAYVSIENRIVMKSYYKNKQKELAGFLTSIEEDTSGNLWCAGHGIGLYRYNIQKEEMTLFEPSMGLENLMHCVLPDRENRVWIAARNKFSVFYPSSGSVTHFTLPLYDNNPDYYNNLNTNKNYIYATYYQDIVKFMPDRLNLKPAIQNVHVSQIKVSGIERSISSTNSLKLEPDENTIEINFGCLINNEIFPYNFEYKLEGLDKKWMEAVPTAIAQYTNLNPGKYQFRVRAVAKNKAWKSLERTINLTIRTPFYQAWWFWFFIGIVLIALTLYFFNFRLRKHKQILTLESKAHDLEKEKTVVMYDSLKQQLNPHFLFNSLTSLSGLIDTNQEMAGEFLEQMSGIYRYILQNSDNETVLLKNELDFVKLYIGLQKKRFKDGLQVVIDIPEEFHHFKIAPVTLQNQIENAIKHNIMDPSSPLIIDIYIEDEQYIVVKNNLQRKKVIETSNKKGLLQFISLYRYLSPLPVRVVETEQSFMIYIPLI